VPIHSFHQQVQSIDRSFHNKGSQPEISTTQHSGGNPGINSQQVSSPVRSALLHPAKLLMIGLAAQSVAGKNPTKRAGRFGTFEAESQSLRRAQSAPTNGVELKTVTLLRDKALALPSQMAIDECDPHSVSCWSEQNNTTLTFSEGDTQWSAHPIEAPSFSSTSGDQLASLRKKDRQDILTVQSRLDGTVMLDKVLEFSPNQLHLVPSDSEVDAVLWDSNEIAWVDQVVRPEIKLEAPVNIRDAAGVADQLYAVVSQGRLGSGRQLKLMNYQASPDQLELIGDLKLADEALQHKCKMSGLDLRHDFLAIACTDNQRNLKVFLKKPMAQSLPVDLFANGALGQFPKGAPGSQPLFDALRLSPSAHLMALVTQTPGSFDENLLLYHVDTQSEAMDWNNPLVSLDLEGLINDDDFSPDYVHLLASQDEAFLATLVMVDEKVGLKTFKISNDASATLPPNPMPQSTPRPSTAPVAVTPVSSVPTPALTASPTVETPFPTDAPSVKTPAPVVVTTPLPTVAPTLELITPAPSTDSPVTPLPTQAPTKEEQSKPSSDTSAALKPSVAYALTGMMLMPLVFNLAMGRE